PRVQHNPAGIHLNPAGRCPNNRGQLLAIAMTVRDLLGENRDLSMLDVALALRDARRRTIARGDRRRPKWHDDRMT
ncbi:hypothetical protein, partial [Bradyrhizobium liaoningense]